MMMRFTKWLSAAFAIGLLASNAVHAQQKGQSQGQKGPTTQGTTGQQGAYHGGYGQTPWFNNQDARQHLKLSDSQYEQLNKGYGQAYGNYQTGMNSLGKDLTDEQRTQKMSELQQGFNKNFSTSANGVFTDPTQQQRYNQLQIQYQGYNAFSNPTVQEKLNLTPEQRQKLGQQGQAWDKQMNTFGAGYKSDPEGTTKKFNEMRTQNGESINSILTPDQRKSYQQMTGESYNFPPSAYFQTSAGTGGGTTPNPK
jgi:hypothetical protein